MPFQAIAAPWMCGIAAFAALNVAKACQAVDNCIRIEYRIHADPTDPQSAVALQVILSLERNSTCGSEVGWKTHSIEFRQPGAGGSADNVWSVRAPVPETSDGLWWVTLADPNNPTTAEFTLPPRYFGVASGEAFFQLPLSYDFHGRTYFAPELPLTPPFEVTAALSVHFHTLLAILIPPEDDEPVEVPPIDNPPCQP